MTLITNSQWLRPSDNWKPPVVCSDTATQGPTCRHLPTQVTTMVAKPWQSHGKTIGKWRFSWENHRKTIGKWINCPQDQQFYGFFFHSKASKNARFPELGWPDWSWMPKIFKKTHSLVSAVPTIIQCITTLIVFNINFPTWRRIQFHGCSHL